MIMECNEIVIKNFAPLKTDNDKTGSDILAMSDFSSYTLAEYSNNLETDDTSLSDLPCKIGLITEAINEGKIILGNQIMLIPDFDRLPSEIREKLKSGEYKIGDSLKDEGNLRATIVDATNNNQRVRDITLKKVKDTTGAIESLRAIAIQAQLKNISNQIDNLQELSMYQIERHRDVEIKARFLNAREYILKAQNVDDINTKKQYLMDAENWMISGYNAIYTDFQTSSKYLAKMDRIPSQKLKNAYMYYLQEDMIIATKMMGLRQAVLYALGETKTMVDVFDTYKNSIKMLIEKPIGRKNRTAIALMHDNFPYTAENLDQWFKFPEEIEPLLETKSYDAKNSLLITLEDENER